MLQIASDFKKEIKTLFISGPSQDMPEELHLAKIVEDKVSVIHATTKKGEPIQIAQIKVEVTGFPPFSASIITEEVSKFMEAKSLNDVVKVMVKTNDKGFKQGQI